VRKSFIFSLVIALLAGSMSSVSASTNIDPMSNARMPIIGTTCSKAGAVAKNAVYQFTCKSEDGKLVWSGAALQYKSPAIYLKGYALGQALKKSNSDGENGALVCKNSADGYVVKNFQIQEGSVSKANLAILNDYYGYMGCWDGFSSTKKAPSTISLTDPSGFAYYYPLGQLFRVDYNIEILFEEIVELFSRSTEEGVEWLSGFQVEGAFDREKTDACSAERIANNWKIKSMVPDMRTLSYSYGSDWRVFPEDLVEFDSGRITSEPYGSTPLKVFVWELYEDDVNGEYGMANWRRLIVNSDGGISHIITQCPLEDESELPKISSWDLEVAPKQIKPPVGKVDKKSNAYKTMLAAGKNFARVSMANDTAKSQCLSAMSTGIIKVRGIPQYLGVQARQLQSFLNTASGFQGCIDGFGK
jgi:hypothetical protein